MPRFVILEHDWPKLHWDFLVESGDRLRSFRLLAEPAMGIEVPAEPNAVHRLFYLDYEGPVSGDRGTVWRWDFGEFDWIVDAPGRADIELRGRRLTGRAVIEESSVRFG